MKNHKKCSINEIYIYIYIYIYSMVFKFGRPDTIERSRLLGSLDIEEMFKIGWLEVEHGINVTYKIG